MVLYLLSLSSSSAWRKKGGERMHAQAGKARGREARKGEAGGCCGVCARLSCVPYRPGSRSPCVCVCSTISSSLLVLRFKYISRLSGLHLDDLASKKENRARDGRGPTEPNKKEGIDMRVARRRKEIKQKKIHDNFEDLLACCFSYLM